MRRTGTFPFTLAGPAAQRRLRQTLIALLFASLLLNVKSHALTTNIWAGPGDGLNNWSAPTNWSLGRFPGPGDYVMFTDAGASATASNVNNVVDASFPGAIGTLHYANSNGFHTTLIAPGQTLVLTGDLIAQAGPICCGSPKTNTIIGTEGALAMEGSSNIIAIGDQINCCSSQCVLDMSALGTFTAN